MLLKKGDQGEDNRFWMSMYTLATAGLNIVVATFFGLGIGWLKDNKLFGGKTHPWFTLIFLLLGIIAGFRNMLMIVMSKSNADFESDDEDKDDKQV